MTQITRRLMIASAASSFLVGNRSVQSQPATARAGIPPDVIAAEKQSLIYLNGDQKITREAALKFPTIVYGPDILGDPGHVRVFESNDAFSTWASSGKFGEQVRQVLQTVRDDVPKERANEALIQQLQEFALTEQDKSFRAFAKMIGKDARDEEVIQRSMIKRTPLTPKVFDPVLLYDRLIEREPPTSSPEDPRTNLLVVPSGFWPNLGWAGWNDRARSVRIFGVNVLCENSWFGGRWGWLIGFNGLLNLWHIGFDRNASSAICF
jgi:hypothetical protein